MDGDSIKDASKKKKWLPCLKCGKEIWTWAGKRICAACTSSNKTERLPPVVRWGFLDK